MSAFSFNSMAVLEYKSDELTFCFRVNLYVFIVCFFQKSVVVFKKNARIIIRVACSLEAGQDLVQTVCKRYQQEKIKRKKIANK